MGEELLRSANASWGNFCEARCRSRVGGNIRDVQAISSLFPARGRKKGVGSFPEESALSWCRRVLLAVGVPRARQHASPRAGPPRHRVLVLLGGAAARAAGAPRAAHLLIALSCPPQGSRRAHIPAAVQRHGQSAASPCLSLLPGPPGTHGLRRCCSTRSADAPQPLRPQRQLMVRPVSACQSRRCHLHAFGPPGPSRGSP